MSTTAKVEPTYIEDLRIRKARALGCFVVVDKQVQYCGITSGEIGAETYFHTAVSEREQADAIVAIARESHDPDNHRFTIEPPLDEPLREAEKELVEAKAAARFLSAQLRLVTMCLAADAQHCDHDAGICHCGEREWMREATFATNAINGEFGDGPALATHREAVEYRERHPISAMLDSTAGDPWMAIAATSNRTYEIRLEVFKTDRAETRTVRLWREEKLPGGETTYIRDAHLHIDTALVELYLKKTGAVWRWIDHVCALIDRGVELVELSKETAVDIPVDVLERALAAPQRLATFLVEGETEPYRRP